MRKKLIIVTVLLASCSGVSRLPSFAPHKIEIRQGNLIAPEMRNRLKSGMSRSQVRTILGTPLISDVFHANRWDYVYLFEKNNKLVEQQRLTLYFEGENLVRIDDANMPPLTAAPVAPEPVVVK